MRRSAPWLTALLQTVILIAVVGFATPWLGADTSSLPTPPRSDDLTRSGLKARPVYNGSVVPGGVYSIEELRTAIARDPIVAAHYGDLDVAEMRVVTLIAPKSAYVSYRRGDRTYWTRGRAGTVSDVQQEAVAAVEPVHGELDDFVVPPTPDPGVDAFAAEAEARLGALLDVPLAPELLATLQAGDQPLIADAIEEEADMTLGGTTTGEFTNGDASTSVSVAASSTGVTPAPEPGSLWLVAAGLVGLASRRLRKA